MKPLFAFLFALLFVFQLVLGCDTNSGQCSLPDCPCPGDLCCSQYGFCGSGPSYCGQTTPSPPPLPFSPPPPSPPSPPITRGVIFSAYKDVGIHMNWNTFVISTNITGKLTPVLDVLPPGATTLTWAFATGDCTNENWAGISGKDLASANVDMFASANVNYVISTGGSGGMFTCDSTEGLKQFVDRYYSKNLIGLDFDIEVGQTQNEIDNLVGSIVGVQAFYPTLRYSFTLATLAASDGSHSCLNSLGALVLNSIQSHQLTNYTINLMAMDYGSPNTELCVVVNGTCEMGQSAIQAAINLNILYGTPYNQTEITPMIGMNDVTSEVTTLSDVDTITFWAQQNGIVGHHFWSFDRDEPCTSSYASSTCSSTSFPTFAFSDEYTSNLAQK